MPDRPRRPLSRLGHRPPTPPGPSSRGRLAATLAAGRRTVADRPAPLVVATIVLVASALSVPATAGVTGLQVPASTRLTVTDPVLGDAGPSAQAAPSTVRDRRPVIGRPGVAGPAVGGPIDPWVFMPLVVDASPVDVDVASLHRPRATPPAGPRASGSTRPASGATKTASAAGSAHLLWPVPGGHISQGFGCTGVIWEPPLGSCPHYHNGIDIAAHEGTPILAAAAGTVVFAGWQSNGGGYQVWVSDGGNMYTGYHHMASVAVYAGERIGRGQRIGAVGMTGNATGPHCHFMVSIGPFWAGGRPVDPRRYL